MSAEVSFHMARPATVLSNASGLSNTSGHSNASGDKKLARSSVSPVTNPVSPVYRSHEQDLTNERAARLGTDQSEPCMTSEWTHLVDTATKAIQDTVPETEENNVNNNNTPQQLRSQPEVRGHSRSSDTPEVTNSDPDSLVARLAALEVELSTERRERGESCSTLLDFAHFYLTLLKFFNFTQHTSYFTQLCSFFLRFANLTQI